MNFMKKIRKNPILSKIEIKKTKVKRIIKNILKHYSDFSFMLTSEIDKFPLV